MFFRGGENAEKPGAGDYTHLPVLRREVLHYLAETEKPCRLIDGTIGCGGHSRMILDKNRQAELLGIDRDGDALERAAQALAFAGQRVHLVRGNYGDLKDLATETGWFSADAILLDIGVSSPQIDDPARGFSYRYDGPLDMRMDSRSTTTASRILNQSSEAELERIFRSYGEIRESRRLARAIVGRREHQPLTTTRELAELCEQVLGTGRRHGPPPPTLCFQALRIAVNDELGELERGLEAAIGLLSPGGMLAVITFHSLEDRIVKNKFNFEAAECICPPGLPVCICKHQPRLKVVTRKPVRAQDDEIAENSRAACAKLRVACRVSV